MGRRSRLDQIGRKLAAAKGQVGLKGKQDQKGRKLQNISKLNKLGDASGRPLANDHLSSLRTGLQADLVAQFDYSKHGDKPKEEMAAAMKAHLAHLCDKQNLPLSRADREDMFEEIVNDLVGLGPLESIISDPKVTDIMINGPDNIYIERAGLLKRLDVVFDSDEQLLNVIRRIIGAVGRRVDEQNAMVDARMLDGSRFNAIIPPLALDGCAVSIRRFGVPIQPAQLVDWNAMPGPMMAVLSACVKAKMNIVISGGTGSGKTTLLNCLSSFVEDGERIVTIEDSAELQLQQSHVIRLESRPPNAEGVGEISQGHLLVHSLRMRPDRIILGEIRGGEAVDMLQAMNSGLGGSMATVHSNSPQDALSRFETMVGIGMPNMSDKFIRNLIASALDIIVQLNRLTDGSRRCTHIAEIQGMEGEYIISKNLFVFDQKDVVDGTIHGVYRPTGQMPTFLSKMRQSGIEVPDDYFDFELGVEGKNRTHFKMHGEETEYNGYDYVENVEVKY